MNAVCEQLGKWFTGKLFLGPSKHSKCFWLVLIMFILNGRSAKLEVGKWCSHKNNGPRISYEVCVDTIKDRIVWSNGVFPAATYDITIFPGSTKKNGKATWKQSSLFHKLPDGKRLVGDSGYIGEPDRILTTLAGYSAETKALFVCFKSRQETIFHGFKALNIMNGPALHYKGKQGWGLTEQMAMH